MRNWQCYLKIFYKSLDRNDNFSQKLSLVFQNARESFKLLNLERKIEWNYFSTAEF